MGVPIIHKYSKVTAYRGRTIPLVLIGTDSGKQHIMDRLAVDVPGPRYFHFPLDKPEQDAVNEVLWNRGYDEIYFRGLTSEEKVPQKRNGRIVYRWKNVAKDHRNEPLDLRVYNLACLASISPDFTKLKALMTGTQAEPDAHKKRHRRPKFGVIKRGIV
jgi:phage terminase large subunit GpA-like protein